MIEPLELNQSELTSASLTGLIVTSLTDVLDLSGATDIEVTPDTPLVGPGAVIDSLGLVTLLVDLEQQLETDHDLILTIADDRAMSMRNSPFRTVDTLQAYILSCAREQQ